MKKLALIFTATLSLAACAPSATTSSLKTSDTDNATTTVSQTLPDNVKTAVFAGGCFWCMESDFEKLDGVFEAVSGYTGGRTDNPNYKTVSYTETGHYEAVEVTYDPSVVNYGQLLDYYWHHIDPTDPNGQFCDKGSSYRTAVFADSSQIAEAEKSKNDIAVSKPFDGPVTTEILPLSAFHIAEEYHQDYYKKNPAHYKRYRVGCRRDARLEQLWGKSDAQGGKAVQSSGSYGSGK
ncbi:MAG: peptide-methionine (S)-S-oxide reductase MsrA [Maricaulaceae bacterium]